MHAELETVLSELHLSMERREAILAAAGRMTERENRRRPLRTGLMAAAICAALAVTAVAVSPSLRETLIQFLGSFEPYAQEVEGVSATDQGIELRVVRVLADKNGGTAYLETVVLLSKLNAKQHIEVELNLDELDLTAAESKATYDEIKAYVLERYGLKVSSLYISQVKRKCGLDVGQNYNLSKKEDTKVPQCPPEKEAAIVEALKHFHMI